MKIEMPNAIKKLVNQKRDEHAQAADLESRFRQAVDDYVAGRDVDDEVIHAYLSRSDTPEADWLSRVEARRAELAIADRQAALRDLIAEKSDLRRKRNRAWLKCRPANGWTEPAGEMQAAADKLKREIDSQPHKATREDFRAWRAKQRKAEDQRDECALMDQQIRLIDRDIYQIEEELKRLRE